MQSLSGQAALCRHMDWQSVPWSSLWVLLLLGSSTSGASDWMHIDLRTCAEVNFLGFIHLE